MPTDSRSPSAEETYDPRQMQLLKEHEPVEGTAEYYEKFAARIAAKSAPVETKGDVSTKKKSELGKVIRLPVKALDDPYLRLEQNFGCELPVCVSNRRDVKKEAIETTVGMATWRLERAASTLLPSPEHHPLWMLFLDRCHAAARAGHVKAPRIVLNPAEVHALLGGNKNGEWYKNIDEAFWRFSHLIVERSTGFCERTGKPMGTEVLGTLCYYASARRGADPNELEDASMGWVAPGPLLWESIRAGYLKAIPMQTMWQLSSYVAQRLFAYLSKHCRAGGQFKISLAKLLPKIPMECSVKEAKRKLRSHHKVLLETGFLAREPLFEGRGANVMVTYERALTSSP